MMLNIECPFCGEREEHEFTCGGEAYILRPLAENNIDHEFGEYLFLRDNPKGVFQKDGVTLQGAGVGLIWFVIQ